ncbi:hypothetical protein CHLRE_09g386741v5 [Chlamydomonas reinhardtii]|uniref:Secreted protein n=1 Tax=Chlamydomonas reinhardtii TaxID=3055 RepID=A0A2K3DCG2_CHLRE|nr:uncharacterized protein CHLRE_12g504302v5 [Chlamydomonas reinhardtii]XP_042920698.1 uncharacterized protein CHLRE_09g386741v5 [Chlamydomonas reinhardtii]PNW74923.1 hypothetical protein CHLRE_12g504302v5 [Chlamydomonas reinhardtii]PNW78220.1 hypothetical protein CHLRE_09g386741v5 [Chlamydomonas reinhardtii]
MSSSVLCCQWFLCLQVVGSPRGRPWPGATAGASVPRLCAPRRLSSWRPVSRRLCLRSSWLCRF